MDKVYMRILLVGPCTERTKGGMASVIRGIFNDDVLTKKFSIDFLPSHAEISFIPKLLMAVNALLRVCIEHRKYDVLHLHVAGDASFFRKGIIAIAGRFFGMKVLFHLHAAGFDRFYNNLSGISRLFSRIVFRCCRRILVLSDFWKDFLISCGIKPEKILVIPNGIDTGSYSNCISRNHGFSSFLFLGRLCERKGIYDLIEVIKELKNIGKINGMKFYLAGDGDLDKVMWLVKDYHIDDRVTVTGWVDAGTKMELLAKSGSVVLPSCEEAFPVSLLEGMASGKVIVSTRIPGVQDMIIEKENGFLFHPGDRKALLDIFASFSDNNTMIKISENNIKKSKALYDFKIFRKSLAEIYST